MLRVREFITFSPTPLSLGEYLYGDTTAFFDVQWEARDFLERELEPDASLRSLIVVTGSSCTAWASTIEEYVSTVWPRTGRRLLNYIEILLCPGSTPEGRMAEIEKSKTECELLFDGSSSSELKLNVRGTRPEIVEIGQQLMWLTSILRNSNDKPSLTYSKVFFESVGLREFRISLCKLIDMPPTRSACWHSLFPSRAVVQGFPIPKRHGTIGLEISYPLMTFLAFSLYPLPWVEGIVLVGDDNVIIPISQIDGSIQWHLIKSYQGSGLDVLNAKNLPEPVVVSSQAMSTFRSFLGFCESAEIHLGTRDPERTRLRSSGAEEDKTGLQISRELSFQLTASSPAIIGGQLGFKANLPRRQALYTPFNDMNLDQTLWNSKDHATLIYDNDAKIAWLVPEASIILHLTHEWLATRNDVPDITRRAFPYVDAHNGGGNTALQAIRNGLDLLIYSAAQSINGVPLYYRDLVKNILRQFYARKQLAAVQNHALDSQNVFNKFWPSSALRGWDAVDIILDKPFPVRRKVDIDVRKAGHWNAITFRNPELLVLLCSNLKAPIRPRGQSVCSFWHSIPAESYYLVASLECLRTLGVARSDTLSSGQAPRYTWKKPNGHKVFEGCEHRNNSACNRLQELVARGAKHPPISMEQWRGAIAFGKELGHHVLPMQECSAIESSCPDNLAIGDLKISPHSSSFIEDDLNSAKTAQTS